MYVDTIIAPGIGRVEDALGVRNTLAFVEEERAGLDEKSHSLQVVISTGKIARDGHSLEPGGVDLKQYKKNPVVLYAHNYDALPIGTAKQIKAVPAEGHVVARPTFHMQTELSREVWALVKAGVLRAWSVGFIPQKARQLTVKELEAAGIDMKEGGDEEDFRAFGAHYAITAWELLEFSSVPVPADAGALSEAVRAIHEGGKSLPQLEGMLRGAGFDIPVLVPEPVRADTNLVVPTIDGDRDEITPEVTDAEVAAAVGKLKDELGKAEAAQRVEETEDFIHVPVRDAGDFIDDTFRNIDISEDEGISAVAGKLTDDGRDGPMTVQKYLFAKEKGWTVDKATTWVADHGKAIEGWLRTIHAAGLDPTLFRFDPPTYAPTYAGRRGAIPYKDLGAADEGEDWDAGEEVKAADVDDLKLMATWVDSDAPDAKGSYKFPHHKQSSHVAVWRGVANAMARLGQSSIPAADKAGVYAHLAKHYAAWDKEPPERARALESVSERVGKVISKATAAKLTRAAGQIEAAAGLLRELATPAEADPEEKVAEIKAAPRHMGAEELLKLAADALR